MPPATPQSSSAASAASSSKKKRRRGGGSTSSPAGLAGGTDELAQLRAMLAAEEEAAELLKLRAELATAKEEAAQLEKEEEQPQKKKKQETTTAPLSPGAGKRRKLAVAAALNGLPICKPVDETPKVASVVVAPPTPPTVAKPASSKRRASPAVTPKKDVVMTPKKAEEEEEEEEEEVGAGWATLERFTAKHERWTRERSSLEDEQRRDEAAKAGQWVKTRPCGEWCEGLSHILAVDCEMCVCEDPVTGARSGRELVRVSVVCGGDLKLSNESALEGTDGDVTIDTLVAPSLPVVDCVTRVHGIKEADLKGVGFTRRHAQAALLKLVCDQTVLVGHAIHNDLESLRLSHAKVVDTSCLYALDTGGTPALRDVAAQVLGAANQMATREHDSTVDARASLLAAAHLLETSRDQLPLKVTRTTSKHSNGNNNAAALSKQQVEHAERSLFAHRIPPNVDAQCLRDALLKASGVNPEHISEIQRPLPPNSAAVAAAPASYGKTTIIFKSKVHAELAFETLSDTIEQDKSGRDQKKLFLLASSSNQQAKPYCKIRTM